MAGTQNDSQRGQEKAVEADGFSYGKGLGERGMPKGVFFQEGGTWVKAAAGWDHQGLRSQTSEATAAILGCVEGGNCRTASFSQAKLHHNAHPEVPGLALVSKAGSVIGSPAVLSCRKLPWYLQHNLPSVFWCVTCDWGCGSASAVGEYQWLMGIIQTNMVQSRPVVSYFLISQAKDFRGFTRE